MALSGHATQFSIYATVVALSLVSCIAIVLRLITRLLLVNRLGWSDVVLLGAWLCSVVMGASIWKQAKHGAGVHVSEVADARLKATLAWFWASLWLYYASLCFTKLSVLLQYLRVFPVQRFIRWCYALTAIVCLWGMFAILTAIFTCWPISKYWNEYGWATGGCLPRTVLWYTNGAIDVGTDIAAASLPIPIISLLDIPKQQKTVLQLVFAAGLLNCVFSIIRLVYIYPLTVSLDFTWQSPLAVIWSCIEANIAILCSCAPTFRGLYQHVMPSTSVSTQLTRVSSEQHSHTLAHDSVLAEDPGQVLVRRLSHPGFGEGDKSAAFGYAEEDNDTDVSLYRAV